MPSVLIADDDPQILAVLRRFLEAKGFDVHEACDGNRALAACREHPPAVAVVDLIMPGKEGLETIQEIRKLHPKVKVIAISGGGLGSPGTYLSLAMRLGAHFSLAKPFGPAELVRAIDELLSRGAAAS